MININGLLTAYLLVYIIVSAVDLFIDKMNSLHLQRHGDKVPDGFEELIDREQLKRIEDYTIDNIRLGSIRAITGRVVYIIIILFGLLPWLAELLRDVSVVIAGLAFFFITTIIGALFGLPFDYYKIFHIEEKYGFNTLKLKTWLADLLKSFLISIILGGVLLSLLLLMIYYAGNRWWVWAWLVFFCFQLVITVIYPTIIAPVFNKFAPLDNEELKGKIQKLAEKESLNIKGIFKMDAARRTRHTNAYFSGLGKTKRIVLYDTLLESHDADEVISVLAHEIGHLKKGHIKKQLIILGFVSLFLFFIASKMIHWEYLYKSFGFDLMPLYAGLLIVMLIWEPFGFFLSPLGMAISRKFEREADNYVYKIMGNTFHMIRALKRIARDNLANLRPHPLYVVFHYSHPPLLERVRELEKLKGKYENTAL